jgi:hypothetical protein
MPTIYLNPARTRTLDRAIRKLEAETGRKFSRAAALEFFVDYALAHLDELKAFLARDRPRPDPGQSRGSARTFDRKPPKR